MAKYKRELLTKEASDLKQLGYSVDYLFNKLRLLAGRDLSFEEEAFWKNAFNEKILLHINEFLEEMANEINVSYKKPEQIEALEIFMNKQ